MREKGKEVYVLDLPADESFVGNTFLLETIGKSFCLDSNLQMTRPKEKNKKEKLLNLFNTWKELILKTAPDVVGLTVNHKNLPSSLFLAHILKVEDPGLFIIFGGPECSMNEPVKVVSSTGVVDLAVYGEGELTLLHLIEALEQKIPIKTIEGTILFQNGRLKRNPGRSAITDLDVLPFPDFSDFPLDHYTGKALPLTMSRGCVGICAFCNERIFWGKKYRFRSPESVISEIQHHTSYGMTSFKFNDSLVNGNIHLLRKLCERLIESNTHIDWYGNARPEKMSLELLETMKEAGCHELRYGVESPVPHILMEMKKGVTPHQAKTVLENTKKVGIKSQVDLICAFPTETKRDFIYSLRWLYQKKDLFHNVLLNRFSLASSTEMFQNPQLYGMTYSSLYDGSDISHAGLYIWESAHVHGDTGLFRYIVITLLASELGKLRQSTIPVSRYEDFSHYIFKKVRDLADEGLYEDVYDRMYERYTDEVV